MGYSVRISEGPLGRKQNESLENSNYPGHTDSDFSPAGSHVANYNVLGHGRLFAAQKCCISHLLPVLIVSRLCETGPCTYEVSCYGYQINTYSPQEGLLHDYLLQAKIPYMTTLRHVGVG
jgi:hypothetical protein